MGLLILSRYNPVLQIPRLNRFCCITCSPRDHLDLNYALVEYFLFRNVILKILRAYPWSTLRLIHITAFSACVCGRWLHCSAEIGIFLSLHWRSPLRNPQTVAASVNEPLVEGDEGCSYPVWPDWAIYWTLGNFSQPLAAINLPKSPTFLGIFCQNLLFF